MPSTSGTVEPSTTQAAAIDGLVAVRDLVRRRLGRDEDAWDLALVQRSET